MTRERLLAGLPVRRRRAGVSTALFEGGAGPPLVLLHGEIGCGGIYWAPVIAQLVANHRVVVPDARVLGESAPFDRPDDQRFARWLNELIDLTCDARPALVAHSLFGTLAARFAAHDDSLARLVVYAARGIGRLPATLLWGRCDRMTSLPLARAAGTRLGWPLHVVDDAAQVPHLEQPDAVVDRLTDLSAAAPLSMQEAVG